MEQIKKYIYQVYKDKSFSAAAKSLFISQPALSAAISRHEKEIGVKIFNRNKQPITLTKQGNLYIESILEIMQIEEALETRLRNLSDMNYAHLKIGAPSFASYSVTSAVSAKFYQKYPNVKLTFNLGARGDSSSFLDLCLKNDEIDLLLTYHKDDPGYIYEELVRERLVIAMHKDFPCPDALKKYAITSEELLSKNIPEAKRIDDLSLFNDIPFISYQDSIHDPMMTKMFKNYNTVPYSIQFAKHSGMHYSVMAAGVGALLFPSLPLLCSPHTDKDIVYFVPKDEEYCHSFYIARTHTTDDNPLVASFIQMAKEICEANKLP